MDKRRMRRICRVLFTVGIIVKIVAIYAVIFSAICVVNGNRWGMLLPFCIGLAMWIAADEMAEAAEKRLK